MPESVTDRPTRAHEYLFLLSKSASYYYDAEAIKEASIGFWDSAKGFSASGKRGNNNDSFFTGQRTHHLGEQTGRNKRTVWEIATEPFPDAHFATFPTALVLPCIQAGTSEHGVCSVCGAPWQRVTEVIDTEGRLGVGYHDHTNDMGLGQRGVPAAEGAPVKRTVGWQPTCKHEAPLERAIVLDPFMGDLYIRRI